MHGPRAWIWQEIHHSLNQLVLEPKTFLQWQLLFFKLTTSRHDETNKD